MGVFPDDPMALTEAQRAGREPLTEEEVKVAADAASRAWMEGSEWGGDILAELLAAWPGLTARLAALEAENADLRARLDG